MELLGGRRRRKEGFMEKWWWGAIPTKLHQLFYIYCVIMIYKYINERSDEGEEGQIFKHLLKHQQNPFELIPITPLYVYEYYCPISSTIHLATLSWSFIDGRVKGVRISFCTDTPLSVIIRKNFPTAFEHPWTKSFLWRSSIWPAERAGQERLKKHLVFVVARWPGSSEEIHLNAGQRKGKTRPIVKDRKSVVLD